VTNPWELVTDTLGSAEHTLETTGSDYWSRNSENTSKEDLELNIKFSCASHIVLLYITLL